MYAYARFSPYLFVKGLVYDIAIVASYMKTINL